MESLCRQKVIMFVTSRQRKEKGKVIMHVTSLQKQKKNDHSIKREKEKGKSRREDSKIRKRFFNGAHHTVGLSWRQGLKLSEEAQWVRSSLKGGDSPLTDKEALEDSIA